MTRERPICFSDLEGFYPDQIPDDRVRVISKGSKSGSIVHRACSSNHGEPIELPCYDEPTLALVNRGDYGPMFPPVAGSNQLYKSMRLPHPIN